MAEYSFMQTLGRGLYSAGGGDLAKYDAIRQEAELAKQKRADDMAKAKLEAAKWQFEQQQQMDKANQAQSNWKFEQEQQLQSGGYQPIGNFPGGDPKDFNVMKVPGGNSYFKPMQDQPKTFSEKLSAMKFEAINAMKPEDRNAMLTGIKPIDDASAWRLANTMAVTELGGSLMSGIGENKDKLVAARQNWYDKLKKGVGQGLVAAGNTQTASDIDSTASTFGF
jgi:multidrug efflux pump subunit AcrA (membrane-fusion protein)